MAAKKKTQSAAAKAKAAAKQSQLKAADRLFTQDAPAAADYTSGPEGKPREPSTLGPDLG